MHTVFIGIGSNLGNRVANCEKAIKLLLQDERAKSLIKSKWYETEAVVVRPDELSLRAQAKQSPAGDCFGLRPRNDMQSPPFINGVVKIETGLSPAELLAFSQQIEREMGRVRTGKKWEPRTIDLDLLLYDDLVMESPGLIIPHPELHKRMFVLHPLCDIAPDLIHPVFRKTIMSLRGEAEACLPAGRQSPVAT